MTSLSATMLIWIAATTLITWLWPRRLQPYVIAACTASFFAWYSPLSMLILLVSAVICYIPVVTRRKDWRIVVACTGAIAAILVWFKIRQSTGADSPEYAVIPLGLSYYSLRLVHFTIDAWKGTLPQSTVGQFLCYLFFLPTLVAGPINRFQEFQRSLRRRRWDAMMFSRGLERILYGCAWIVIMGNYVISFSLNKVVARLAVAHPALSEYLECASYGLNLFCQFAGYSDVAIGFAMLLGFTVCENFNYPLLARNIGEFWRRWHMSLSSWCRDYVYMPVLSVSRLPALAALSSMIVLGLWHEVSLRYLAWGLYHGVGIAVWQVFRKAVGNRTVPTGLPATLAAGAAWFATMNFVLLGFAITKERSLVDALAVYRTIFGL
ncbi:MAG: MBOAT family O-acyltransferase [bacterium]